MFCRSLPTRYVYRALKIVFVCIDSCAVKGYDILTVNNACVLFVLRHGVRHLQFGSVHIGWRPYIRLQSVVSLRHVRTLLWQLKCSDVNTTEIVK